MDLKYTMSHKFPNDTRISWRTSLFYTIQHDPKKKDTLWAL